LKRRTSVSIGVLLIGLIGAPAIAAQGSHQTDFTNLGDVNGTICDVKISLMNSFLAGDEISAVEDFLSADASQYIILGMRRTYETVGGVSINRYVFFNDWTGSDGNEHYETYNISAGSYLNQQLSFMVDRFTDPEIFPAIWTLSVWKPDGNISNPATVATSQYSILKSIVYTKNLNTCVVRFKSDYWDYMYRISDEYDPQLWSYITNSASFSFSDSCPLYGHATGSISNGSTGTIWLGSN